MTQEEKAKVYDEAIIRMKAWVHEHPDAQKEAQFVFPELKESEDERIRNLIYCLIRDRSDNRKLLEHNGCSVEKALSWLEKQGQQNPAWSEEDENWMNYFEKVLEFAYNNDVHVLGKSCLAGKMWLKSLKERYTWKPSDEQMRALELVVQLDTFADQYQKEKIVTLFNDLKKLKG